MDWIKRRWESGISGKATVILIGLFLLGLVGRVTEGTGKPKGNADGLSAEGALAALQESGVSLPNPRDNSGKGCECISLITTDAVSIEEYETTEDAAEAVTSESPIYYASGRFKLRMIGTLSDNALPYPNRESYQVALDAYVAGEPIPAADPMLGMPGVNGCQLASESFLDMLTNNAADGGYIPISRVYFLQIKEGRYLVSGSILKDEKPVGLWTAPHSPAGDLHNPDKTVMINEAARTYTALDTEINIARATLELDNEITALTECSMME